MAQPSVASAVCLLLTCKVSEAGALHDEHRCVNVPVRAFFISVIQSYVDRFGTLPCGYIGSAFFFVSYTFSYYTFKKNSVSSNCFCMAD